MTQQQQDSDQIASLFAEAVQLKGKSRAEFLQSIDENLRTELEPLLNADLRVQQEHLLTSLQPEAPSITRIRDYELRHVIGEGGMGTVYQAYHSRLKCDVALKVLPIGRSSPPETVARFEREMAAVGKLKHPHIVQAMDAGEENGIHYLVFELVEGVDAAQVIKACQPVEIADACEIVRQAALGLEHAHQQGLVHRDVKPSNLLVSKSGQVSIADMGLALLNDSGPRIEKLTAVGQIMGTLDYIPPEQIDDPHNVGPPADLYSLGCTLYHLLAGRAPFDVPEFDATLKKLRAHETTKPQSLKTLRPQVPPKLAQLVHTLVEKSPEDRMYSAKQVADELKPFCPESHLDSLIEKGIAKTAEATTANLGLSRISTELWEKQTDALPEIATTNAIARKSRIPHWLFTAFVLVGALLFAITLSQVFRWRTKHGTVIVETVGGDVDLSISESELRFIDPTDGEEVTVTVDEAKDLLVFRKSGFESVSRSVKLKSGAGQRLSIRFEPTSEISKPQPEMGAKSKLVQAIDYAFENGLQGFAVEGSSELHNDSDCLTDGRLRPNGHFRFIQTANTPNAMQRISSVKEITDLYLVGATPLLDSVAAQMTRMPAIQKLYIYCPFRTEQFESTPIEMRTRLITLALHGEKEAAVTDNQVREMTAVFSSLERLELTCEKLTSAVLPTVNEQQPEQLHLIRPSDEILRQLDSLDSVVMLKLDDATGCNLSHLPPRMQEFWCDSTQLSPANFKDLAAHEPLRVITSRLARVDRDLVTEFQKARPDCVFQSYFEPRQASAAPNATSDSPVHAIAAFNNRKGYSYVFLNNGSYLKLNDRSNRLAHSLTTSQFWKHLIGNRANDITAAFTQNDRKSFVILNDGTCREYLNLPDIGIGTHLTTKLLDGVSRTSPISAATDWPDGTYFVFQRDGRCRKYDDQLKRIDTKTTDEVFPFLKGRADTLTAVRVDPVTALAYFYFVGGTELVYDTMGGKVINEHALGAVSWVVPEQFASREETSMQEFASTRHEGLRWAFQNGVESLTCSVDGEEVVCKSADEFNSRTHQLIGVVLNYDSPQASRALFCIARYTLIPELRLVSSSKIVADELERIRASLPDTVVTQVE